MAELDYQCIFVSGGVIRFIELDNYCIADNIKTYAVIEPTTLQTLQSSSSTSCSDSSCLNDELFVSVTGYLLVTFVVGHALGRLLKALGRA